MLIQKAHPCFEKNANPSKVSNLATRELSFVYVKSAPNHPGILISFT